MNLSRFLKLIDEECGKKSRDDLGRFVHEAARRLPAEKRSEFLDMLKSAGESGRVVEDDVHKNLQERYSAIVTKLEKIKNAELELDSEINESYDDWYHDEEEFLFSDPENIGEIVESACGLLYDCIDNEEYVLGSEIAEILLNLEISVSGDYSDYAGDNFSLSDLFDHDFVETDIRSMLLCALYAEYRSFETKDRPNALYWIFSNYASYGVNLEQLMQYGDELPEFDEFLKLWISYLGGRTDGLSQKLLKEAMELSDDEDAFLENARKYAATHPGLYETYIENRMKAGFASEEAEEALYAIGQEALRLIDQNYVVRSRIALLMLQMAIDLDKKDEQDECMLEAFRSDSTAANYLRLRLNGHNIQKYESEIVEICRRFYMRRKWFYPEDSRGELTENEIGSIMAYMLAFLLGDFDAVLKKGMDKKDALGWSGTFMKCGLAAFLLLLLESERLQGGGMGMCRMVIGHIGNLQFENTGKMDRDEDEIGEFWNTFSAWKNTIRLSSEQKIAYLTRMEKLVETRVQGIMEANRRKYYGECAAYVAALGEVKASIGEPGGKQAVMEKYRSKYSRRSAFRQALCEYGMMR